MITLELNYPHSDLMPNRKNGKHWSSTIKVKDNAKQEGYYSAFNARITNLYKPTDLIPLEIIFMQSDKRKRDLDNLLASAKNYLDGVASGLKIDDKQFEPITIKRGYGEVSKMILKIG